MNKSKPIAGVDFWPDAADWPNAADEVYATKPTPKTPTLIVQALLFLLVFAVLQVSWLVIRDYALGHFIRGDLTVKPAVCLINLLSPQTHAVAYGNQILATGGGLVVKLGCEGVEALFILMAALTTAPLSQLAKVNGVLWGAVFIYGFNQIRILCLFYAFRTDKPLFYLLHGTIAPLVLIAMAGLFFQWWLVKNRDAGSESLNRAQQKQSIIT